MFSFLFQVFIVSLSSLRLHKLRTLLTALGIIFGVAAVIIMVAIGEGAKTQAREQMEKLGATNVLLRSIKPPESGESSGRSQRVLTFGLKRTDLARMQTLAGVRKIVPMRDCEQQVPNNGVRLNANAIGTTADAFEVINLRLARGELFTPLHEERESHVCVLGAQVAADMFPSSDPLGQLLQVGSASTGVAMLRVIGVLEPTGLRVDADKGSIIQRDVDRDIYFPLSVAQDAFGDVVMRRQAGSMERKEIELSEIWLQTHRIEDVEAIASAAGNLLSINGRVRADVEVKAPIQILRAAEAQQKTYNFIMVGIASFSLVVGGIGIMNIMLATVTERTREIGIRRALGAKRRHITLQFLIETTLMSIGGGLIGIVLGISIAELLPIVVQLSGGGKYPTDITTWSVAGSFVVSAAVGIGFGLYPAVMAARMNPIEALRHE